ncbi:hypothetical protein [Mariniblastus fucicola]|uniref:Uncharacterized protein n=1 Tax=Mariniblastus fucicola TaxID=980251 RepID=A0A5B9PEI4_9BACT|nr:hypothetical protein [Mariniblastus fucicola]QEG23342.1 hypothetical protein MFFC18_32400 [Mariniblastus fucicola]
MRFSRSNQSSPIRVFRFAILLVFVSLLFGGCSNSTDAVKTADEEGPKSIASGLQKVDIDDVLARTDYP